LWKSIFLTETASDFDSAWDSELPAWDSITTILVWDWLQLYLQLILIKLIIIFYLWKSIFLTKTASDCDSAWDSEASSLRFNHNYFGLRLTTQSYLQLILSKIIILFVKVNIFDKNCVWLRLSLRFRTSSLRFNHNYFGLRLTTQSYLQLILNKITFLFVKVNIFDKNCVWFRLSLRFRTSSLRFNHNYFGLRLTTIISTTNSK